MKVKQVTWQAKKIKNDVDQWKTKLTKKQTGKQYESREPSEE